MIQLKYFTKTGNQYKMKPQNGFSLIVIIGMAGAAVAGIYTNLPALTWIFGILTILFVLAIYLKNTVIDMDKKELFLKMGLLAPAIIVPFSEIVNFELSTIKQSFITTNASLSVVYLKDGKEKRMGIAEGFTVRAMQNILNEIDEIMHPDGRTGKI